MNILIVDDEEVLRDVLTQLVRQEGHEPICASTGEEALTLLADEDVDLVLLDLMLPGLTGQEVLKQIRDQDPDQVIIVITAFSSIDTVAWSPASPATMGRAPTLRIWSRKSRRVRFPQAPRLG